jgi:hypothetical protein
MGQTFFEVSGSSVDTYFNINVAVYCDTILFAVLVFFNNQRFTRAYAHAIIAFSISRSQNVKFSYGNIASHNLKNKRCNRLMCNNTSKYWHSSTKSSFVCFLNYRSVSQKKQKVAFIRSCRGLTTVWRKWGWTEEQ